MKKHLLLLSFLLLSTFSFAKNPVNAYKDLKSGKKDDALKSFLEINKKDSVSVIVNYSLALLYSDSNFSLHNLELSYRYSQKANKCISSNNWNELVAGKELKDIEKTNIKPLQVRLLKDSIISLIYNNLLKKKTINGFKQFVKDYPDAKEKEEATQYIYTLAWANTIQKLDDISGFEQFIKEYPEAKQVETAKYIINSFNFEEAKKKNTIEAYERFIKNYPNAEQIDAAKDLLKDLNTNDYCYIINPTYDEMLEFHDGFAAAKLNGKWGFIDTSGRVVIPFDYDIVSNFSEGKAGVGVGREYGYINKSGKIIIPIIYYYTGTPLENFHEGTVNVRIDRDSWACLNSDGQKIIPNGDINYGGKISFNDGLAFVDLPNYRGFIDKTGKIVSKTKYGDMSDFSDGYSFVKVDDDSWGAINKKNELVFKIENKKIRQIATCFCEGLALIRGGEDTGYKFGYIDTTGYLAIPPQYDIADGFKDNIALVYINKKCGFINRKGKFIIEPQFENAGYFNENIAMACINNKCGFINKKGKFIIEPQFESAGDFYNNVAPVKLNGKWAIIGICDKTNTSSIKI